MLSYESRIAHLRQMKAAQTAEKLRRNGDYMNEDDYGSVPGPEGFRLDIEFNDPVNKTFYGAALWAKNFNRLLRAHPVYVDAQDALAGRWMFILQRLRPFENATSNNNMEMAPIFDYSHLKPVQQKYGIIPGIGKMHHFAPDFSIGLQLGWGGLRDKVEKYRRLRPEAPWLYDAEIMVLDGIQDWFGRTVQAIAQMAQAERDPELRQNLHAMKAVNEKLIAGRPETFREACQWIAWCNMLNRTYNRAGSGMQLDEILRPYYENDVKNGLLTAEEAQFILACLLINDPVYYQIGGPDENGADMTSELSFLILEAAHMAGTTVNLTIRVHDGLNPALLRRGVEILVADKKACPRFSGDRALVEGFMRLGYSKELACRRIAVGCQWMSLPGLEYTLNDLIKINFAKVMEVALDEYMAVPESARSVEALYRLFLRHLRAARDCVAEGIDFHLAHQYQNAPELMLNLLCHGPIEKGLDASNGGMEYYNIGVDGAALATVADSFAALQQRIEDEQRLNWEDCYRAVHTNFEGAEGDYIRRMLQASDRFGHGLSCGDAWAKRISRDFADIIISRRTPGGVLMIPGLFSWANTINLGLEVGATANGRRAGEPISHGANPHPGFRKDGALTAQATAVAEIQCGYGNTAPLQMEYSPSGLSEAETVEILLSMITTHFAMGGTLININVIDKAAILDAYEHPEAHPDLIVRVTGFTAYFAALSPAFRKLVIDRIIAE